MVSWLMTWCCREIESPLWMYMQGYVAWRMLLSRPLVMINYGTTLMCDLPWTPPLKRFLCRFLKQSNNICHHRWIKRLYNSDVFLSKFPTNSEVSIKNQNLFVFNRVIKITCFMCSLMSPDFGSDCTHTSSLCILCCKGEALEIFSVERQLIVLKLEIDFPCYWDAGVCSFALLFNPCILKSSQFISHEETDEQPDQMDFYPNAWPPANECELLNPSLPMDNKRTYSMSKVVQKVGFTNL
jgi:hypothetical protein